MSQIQRFFAVLFFSSLLAIAGCSKSDSTSGIENTNDLDKDGIIDIQDPDIDGDGIPNEKDPDMDGDGIPNGKDPDANGDGLDDFGPPGLPGQCPSSATGTYPNCECPTDSVYVPQANDCAPEAGWNPIVAGCYIEDSNIKRLVNSYIAEDEEALKACGPIGTWDVSRVTDMAGLFQNTSFNEDINDWQVRQVTNFTSMFGGAEQFNKPLNKWSINTTSLWRMFKGAKSFNQDIRGWQLPNEETGAYGYLLNGTAFTYDLSVWCLDKVAPAVDFAVGSPIADQPDKQPRWSGSSCKAELPDVVQCSDLEGVEGGKWPNCTCEQEGYEFNSTTNSCDVRPKTCLELGFPGGDPYPPCTCGGDRPIWDQESLSCVAEPPLLGPGVETICNGSVFVYTGRYLGTTYAQAWDQCALRSSGLPSEEQIKEGCLDPYLKNPTSVWTSTVTQDGTEVRVLTQSWIEVNPSDDSSKKFNAYCVQPKNPRPEFPPGTRADLDGDGTPNDRDPDIDGDGLTNDKDPDMDGDGTPNGSDPDVDGDGTPNTSDKDIDGDGIENKNDPDIDGDGIKNGIDKDSDGDGTPDAEDDTPGGRQ
jgi:hypothetical protein